MEVDGNKVAVDENKRTDIVSDLIHMTLPMGKLYKDMSKNSKFGFLPRMAQASKGQIGALNAESFCERCLSCIYRHDES